MKHNKFTVDIDGWDIDALDEIGECLENKIRAATVEALGYAMENINTYIYFPIEWSREKNDKVDGTDGIGGMEVDDPLTVYLRVGLSGELEPPTYEFNLRDALQSTIDDCKEDGSFSVGLCRLSEALKELASDIDAATAT